MNKFRIHTHRVWGDTGIYPIHLHSNSTSLEIVTVYEGDIEGHDLIYITSEGSVMAVYPIPSTPYSHTSLRYITIPEDDPWSPYKVSP